MEDLKKIIAVFIKKDAENISESTLINGKTIPGSIMLHRMYAAIENAGYNVEDYSSINTYGDLIFLLNGETIIDKIINTKENTINYKIKDDVNSIIGIDIESIDNLPLTNDFREHEFYVNNFSAQEISYCLFRSNPYETFAGLFSAKEALCKVNNSLIGQPFSKINIQHTDEGKPSFQNYSISISHTKKYSVAIALLNNGFNNASTQIILDKNKNQETDRLFDEKPTTIRNSMIDRISLGISLISLLVALVLLFLYLKR